MHPVRPQVYFESFFSYKLRAMMNRTHYAGSLTEAHRDQHVVVMGWVQHRRDHGGCVFIDLRDREGLVQIVFDPAIDAVAHAKAAALRSEWVIGVCGLVRGRGGHVNAKLASGTIEVGAMQLHIFAQSKPPPFQIDDSTDTTEEVRLKYRYLDLRRPQLQRNLRRRHAFLQIARQTLDTHGFLELETPFLSRSTPEGARDDVVPSRVNPGRFFALPQSPQLFKQLFMVAGFDRYFQIARCFRDEDLRADRQPEFTQIDMEMSFCTPGDVQTVVEEILAKTWAALLGVVIARPFVRIGYDEAMARFGVDAPDMRFGLELVDLRQALQGTEFAIFAQVLQQGGAVKGIKLEGLGALSRRELDEYGEFVKIYGATGLAWVRIKSDGSWQSPLAKFLSDAERGRIAAALGLGEGDVAVFLADRASVVNAALGQLRKHIAKRHNLVSAQTHAFCWVTDFPLFERDETREGRYTAAHHPFTAPAPEHAHLLHSDPGAVRAQAYDIVLNGIEIGGGSIRIHNSAQQLQALAALGIDTAQAQEQFGFLLDALAHGAPPHGGLALGVDRICMLLCEVASIRDVIAFPKTQKQTDLMLDAPARLAQSQLDELSLQERPTLPKD